VTSLRFQKREPCSRHTSIQNTDESANSAIASATDSVASPGVGTSRPWRYPNTPIPRAPNPGTLPVVPAPLKEIPRVRLHVLPRFVQRAFKRRSARSRFCSRACRRENATPLGRLPTACFPGDCLEKRRSEILGWEPSNLAVSKFDHGPRAVL
jgi:hypothetical protein